MWIKFFYLLSVASNQGNSLLNKATTVASVNSFVVFEIDIVNLSGGK